MQHSGLINLGIVIILATNSRLILENITKYGLRATPLTWLQRAISVSTSSNRHTLVGFIGLCCCILAAWAIEFLGKRRLQCASFLRVSACPPGSNIVLLFYYISLQHYFHMFPCVWCCVASHGLRWCACACERVPRCCLPPPQTSERAGNEALSMHDFVPV